MHLSLNEYFCAFNAALEEITCSAQQPNSSKHYGHHRDHQNHYHCHQDYRPIIIIIVILNHHQLPRQTAPHIITAAKSSVLYPRGGIYWEMHPPRPKRFPEGDIFPNASRLEAVYVHSLSITREVLTHGMFDIVFISGLKTAY